MSVDRAEVRDFLVSRRAKISPEQAGLSHYGGNRRVPGLRREEVALIAGVSVDYYTRLEKGNLAGASETVLEAVARALRLDEAERSYLFDLARAANHRTPPPRRRAAPPVRRSVELILAGMSNAPAFVRNGRLDVLAVNPLGRALYAPVFESSPERPNMARFAFLDPRSHDFYPDWDGNAHTTVALLRTEAGRAPYDRSLSDLIGELATRSDEFRTRWAAHNVRLHRTGVKHFNHPTVGRLDLVFEALTLEGDDGLTLTAFSAEPGSSSHDGLQLLASWSATIGRPEAADQADR